MVLKIINLNIGHGERHTIFQWACAISANTVLLTYGLQNGWISPMSKHLTSDSSPTGAPLSETTVSWLASTMSIVAAMAVPLFSYLADRIGRRKAIICIAVPQALCWILKLTATSIYQLFLGRACAGLGAAGCFIVVVIYVKEISQDNIRGVLGTLLALSENLGIFAMYGIGAYLDYYRSIWAVIWLPFLSMALMLLVPESPAYLVKIGDYEGATTTIAWLRGLRTDDKEASGEVEVLKKQKAVADALPSISFRHIFKHQPWRCGFLIVILVMTVQSCNGCFSILTFASPILAKSGATVSPDLQSMSFPMVMILGSFVSMACVDRFGRKPLLSIGLFLTALFMAGLATCLLLIRLEVSVPGWLPVVSIIAALLSFASGVLPIPTVLKSEIFNFQIRATVVGYICMYAWMVSAFQLVVFNPISAWLGLYTTFYIFAGINIIGVFIAVFLLPETKGKTVEQIEVLLTRDS